MIANVPTAHPQKSGENPDSCPGINPTKEMNIIATNTIPTSSKIFIISPNLTRNHSKRYIILRFIRIVDKYLLVVLMFLVAGMGIMVIQGKYVFFYAMLAGAIIVVLYSSIKTRKEQKELRKKRRKYKK